VASEKQTKEAVKGEEQSTPNSTQPGPATSKSSDQLSDRERLSEKKSNGQGGEIKQEESKGDKKSPDPEDEAPSVPEDKPAIDSAALPKAKASSEGEPPNAPSNGKNASPQE
jgi:hypothetical protein